MSVETKAIILKAVFILAIVVMTGIIVHWIVSDIRKRRSKKKGETQENGHDPVCPVLPPEKDDMEKSFLDAYEAEHEGNIDREMSREIKAIRNYTRRATLGHMFTKWLGDNICRNISAINADSAILVNDIWMLLSMEEVEPKTLKGCFRADDADILDCLRIIHREAANYIAAIREMIPPYFFDNPDMRSMGDLYKIPFECRIPFTRATGWNAVSDGKGYPDQKESDLEVILRDKEYGVNYRKVPCIYIPEECSFASLLGNTCQVLWNGPGFYCYECESDKDMVSPWNDGKIEQIVPLREPSEPENVVAWSKLELFVPELFSGKQS